MFGMTQIGCIHDIHQVYLKSINLMYLISKKKYYEVYLGNEEEVTWKCVAQQIRLMRHISKQQGRQTQRETEEE